MSAAQTVTVGMPTAETPEQATARRRQIYQELEAGRPVTTGPGVTPAPKAPPKQEPPTPPREPGLADLLGQARKRRTERDQRGLHAEYVSLLGKPTLAGADLDRLDELAEALGKDPAVVQRDHATLAKVRQTVRRHEETAKPAAAAEKQREELQRKEAALLKQLEPIRAGLAEAEAVITAHGKAERSRVEAENEARRYGLM